MKRVAPGQARIRPSQRGLTLIELMIALLIASLMIGLVFSIYTRMSVAYRSQSEVSELQQTLRAAKMRMVQDVRAAGHLIPNGFAVTGVVNPQQPVVVENDTLPADSDFDADLIQVFYADTSAMAKVNTWDKNNKALVVDDNDAFAVNDLIVAVQTRALSGTSPGVAAIAEYDACLLQITALDALANKLKIEPVSAFNSTDNSHCDAALAPPPPPPPVLPDTRMVYRLASRAYRIDPDPDPKRRAAGILQMSPSGGLVAGDWEDIGIGFTDIQVAVRYHDDDALDQDGDGDPLRDWYSGDVQPAAATSWPLEMSVSLVLRTTHEVELVPTSATPELRDASNIDHNSLGDAASIDLSATPDSARPLQLRGNHIYRYTTVRVDMRNLGVGR